MAFHDLTTLADVKAWLQTGQSNFPATDDALLTNLVTAASHYIQTWLNRQIASADYLEVRDGTGGRRMQFACFPVSAVLSLTIDGKAIRGVGRDGHPCHLVSLVRHADARPRVRRARQGSPGTGPTPSSAW